MPSKAKIPAKKITKSIAVKKALTKKSPAKKTIKSIAVKKVASKSAATKVIPAKKKMNSVVTKKVKSPVKKIAAKKVVSKSSAGKTAQVKNKIKPVVTKEIKKSTNVKVKNLPEIKMHGEDLHFIPVHEEKHPITTMEAHEAENEFHHLEEVEFRQENQKVRDALPSRKSPKRRM